MIDHFNFLHRHPRKGKVAVVVVAVLASLENHWTTFCKFSIWRISQSRKFNNFRLALAPFWYGEIVNSVKRRKDSFMKHLIYLKC